MMSSGGQAGGDGRTDETVVLDLLFSHKLEWVRDMLKEQSLLPPAHNQSYAQGLRSTLKAVNSITLISSVCWIRWKGGAISTFTSTRRRTN